MRLGMRSIQPVPALLRSQSDARDGGLGHAKLLGDGDLRSVRRSYRKHLFGGELSARVPLTTGRSFGVDPQAASVASCGTSPCVSVGHVVGRSAGVGVARLATPRIVARVAEHLATRTGRAVVGHSPRKGVRVDGTPLGHVESAVPVLVSRDSEPRPASVLVWRADLGPEPGDEIGVGFRTLCWRKLRVSHSHLHVRSVRGRRVVCATPGPVQYTRGPAV